MLMVAGLTAVERDAGLPDIRPLKSLGDASYSIYLTHTLTMGALAVSFGIWNTPWFTPAAFVVGVAGGWVVWRVMEAPVQALLRTPKPVPAAQLA